ncbi:MAG TPA: hypothetical protein GXX51_03510 [Firmicutes bacterium]|nr:hypothetical protein [Bacillota bacterium]
MKTITFFLGAGASAADGAPVMSRYLEEVERCFGNRDEWREMEPVLMSCPCPVSSSSKYPAISDFLTYLDEAIAEKSLVNGQDPERIRFLLLRLMFGRLTEQERPRPRFTWTKHTDVAPEPDLGSDREPMDACQHSDNSRYNDYTCPDAAPPPSIDYVGSAQFTARPPVVSQPCSVDHLWSKELVELAPSQLESAKTSANRRLAELAVDWGVKAVISTNYDLIFDQALEDLKVKFHYCVGYSEGCEAQHGIKFLKLHGSVNWLLCRGCAYVDVWRNSYPTQTLWAEESISKPCRRCSGTRWTDMLVTPARRRSYEYLSLGLQPVWDETLAELLKTDIIVFIGYSLPPEDRDILDLLYKGVRKEAKVLVVDPSEDTVNRYRETFGPLRVTPIPKSLSADLWDAPEVRNTLEQLGIGGGNGTSALT